MGLDFVNVLLDTHALLWALTSPDRLSDTARAAVEDPRNDLRVSAASAWEVSTKHRLGKLPSAGVLVQAYDEHLRRLGVVDLPVTSRHALAAGSLELSHRDPFDRMIAAQCVLESLPLVTADDIFSTVPGVRVLW